MRGPVCTLVSTWYVFRVPQPLSVSPEATRKLSMDKRKKFSYEGGTRYREVGIIRLLVNCSVHRRGPISGGWGTRTRGLGRATFLSLLTPKPEPRTRKERNPFSRFVKLRVKEGSVFPFDYRSTVI